jgi:hypothetical protein
VRLGAKLFRTKTSLHFASEAPKIVFLKNTFQVRIFFLNRTTITIEGQRTMWHYWGKIFPGAKFRSSKKHACVPNFLTKPPPHVFLGQNGQFGAFWGKTISHKNFAPFCLLSPQNRFSEKTRFRLEFFYKTAPQ